MGWGVVRGLEPWDNVSGIIVKSSNKCEGVRLVKQDAVQPSVGRRIYMESDE